ncbi:hypothetical protein SS05631_c18430 [Sinorhizobium sp. CCBAU 05631]|nr:hypothetical protein SS05631_c18430 [Sinorhizobium sp. CCBAU 05631]
MILVFHLLFSNLLNQIRSQDKITRRFKAVRQALCGRKDTARRPDRAPGTWRTRRIPTP